MPRHTSRLSGHPSILDAVINYRGARRSGIISGISLWPTTRVYRRWFIESIDSTTVGSKPVSPLGRLIFSGKCKIEALVRREIVRDRNEARCGDLYARYPATIDGIVEGADFTSEKI